MVITKHALQWWLRIALLNLLIVAAIGATLRYKIAFSLPFIDQKNLLHGHSHFAFSGWLTMALMALMVHDISQKSGINYFKKYKPVLWANLLASYGMLITFPIQGYGLYSIIFSTFSIFVSYYFAVIFWKDLNRLSQKTIGHLWYKAALVFNVLSSLGAFSLAYMMATTQVNQSSYLLSVYYFLHFQYNGWFFFACMGLFIDKLFNHGILVTSLKNIFLLFVLACVPAYFLSVLWLNIPLWGLLIIGVAATAQMVAWTWLFVLIKKNSAQKPTLRFFKLLLLPALALTIKFALQLGSTIPALSDMAFGFRPIVIGYLHLILLAVITLFLLLLMVVYNYIKISRTMMVGLIIFIAGVILNELLLMVQGIAALDYHSLPLIQEYLFIAALILFAGMLVFNYSQYIGKKITT